MKKLILTIALAVGTSAFADTQFVPAYNLSFFNIAEQSVLPQNNIISGGQILVDSSNSELQLVLNRGVTCQTKICPRLMMLPFQMTLPITVKSADNCGISTVVAEQDLRAQGGEYVQLQIVSHEGDRCLKSAMTLRSVSVTLTEQSATDSEPVVSTMSGLPVQD